MQSDKCNFYSASHPGLAGLYYDRKQSAARVYVIHSVPWFMNWSLKELESYLSNFVS